MRRQSLQVLPPMLSQRVFISISIQAPISIVYALHSKLYIYSIMNTFVWLCGMNYWRDPQYNSWRRMIDIGWILIVGGYHLRDQLFIRNYLSLVYCHILLLVFGSYWKARKSRIKSLQQSTKWHLGVHFFGTLSNMVAYTNLRSITK